MEEVKRCDEKAVSVSECDADKSNCNLIEADEAELTKSSDDLQKMKAKNELRSIYQKANQRLTETRQQRLGGIQRRFLLSSSLGDSNDLVHGEDLFASINEEFIEHLTKPNSDLTMEEVKLGDEKAVRVSQCDADKNNCNLIEADETELTKSSDDFQKMKAENELRSIYQKANQRLTETRQQRLEEIQRRFLLSSSSLEDSKDLVHVEDLFASINEEFVEHLKKPNNDLSMEEVKRGDERVVSVSECHADKSNCNLIEADEAELTEDSSSDDLQKTVAEAKNELRCTYQKAKQRLTEICQQRSEGIQRRFLLASSLEGSNDSIDVDNLFTNINEEFIAFRSAIRSIVREYIYQSERDLSNIHRYIYHVMLAKQK